MNRYLSFFLLSCFGLSAGCVCAQKPVKRIGDFIESTSYNDHKRGASRSLQYYPEGDDFVCVNGKNRYTRALYGSWSPFRLETSDRPVFATYDKRNSKNIRFRISMPGGYSAMLDSVGYCEARYTPAGVIISLTRLGEKENFVSLLWHCRMLMGLSGSWNRSVSLLSRCLRPLCRRSRHTV